MSKITATAIIFLLLISGAAMAIPVDECGYLAQAVEGCLTFQVIDGNFYEIGSPSNLSGYGVGDTVRIIGNFYPGISICMSGGLPYLYADTAIPCPAAYYSTCLPMSSTETMVLICMALLLIGSWAIRRYKTANRMEA